MDNILAQYGLGRDPIRNALSPREILMDLSGLTGDRGADDLGHVDPNDIRYFLQPQKRTAYYASPAPDDVWPSHETMDNFGITEDARSRIGKIEAALLSGVDSLGFGFPMAIAKQVAPDFAAGARRIMDAHTPETTVSGLVAGVGNPANALFRTAGNALATRGYGIGSQAAADALSAAALYGAPNALSGNGLGKATEMGATTAGISRFLMPKIPNSLAERALRGAQAGAMGGAFEASHQGDITAPIVGGAFGAMHGVGLKRDRGLPRFENEAERARYLNTMMHTLMASEAVAVPSKVMKYLSPTVQPDDRGASLP